MFPVGSIVEGERSRLVTRRPLQVRCLSDEDSVGDGELLSFED